MKRNENKKRKIEENNSTSTAASESLCVIQEKRQDMQVMGLNLIYQSKGNTFKRK